MKVTFQGTKWPISVDLVPSLRIPWPKKLRNLWRPTWPQKGLYQDIDYVHAVSKTHLSGMRHYLMNVI